MVTTANKKFQSYKTVGTEIIAQYNYEFRGTSEDTKPTGYDVGNGSVYIEMDGGKVYFFDEENGEWREF